MNASPGTAYVRCGRNGVEEVGEGAKDEGVLGGYVSRLDVDTPSGASVVDSCILFVEIRGRVMTSGWVTVTGSKSAREWTREERWRSSASLSVSNAFG
jgi:hypothetical protein